MIWSLFDIGAVCVFVFSLCVHISISEGESSIERKRECYARMP